MAILLDISKENNYTGIDLFNCYGRIENIHYHYKSGSLKCTFSVYYNKDVGILRRIPEEHMRNQIVRAMEITEGKPIAGLVAREYTLGPDPILMDSGLLFHPQFVYSDTYAIIVAFENVSTEAVAYNYFYELIKADPRFTNVRDDL